MKYFLRVFLFLLIFSSVFPDHSRAAEKNYVTLIFPVRAREYWRQGSNIENFTALRKIVADSRLPATWLVHYDVLSDGDLMSGLSQSATPFGEIGLFLEVTRKLAAAGFVPYDWQGNPWSAANKLFLSGYTRDERKRLIDCAFQAFSARFGHYPAVYGAWYTDVWSMEYIRDKYHSRTVLGLADQYSTDGYQTWGQYFNLPYIVSKTSAIEPAKDASDSAGILKLQWAPREPLLGYGNSVDASNYSAQVNDYARGKNLDPDYFKLLLENILIKPPGQISQTVVGVEAGELEEKYFPDLISQLKVINILVSENKLQPITAGSFGDLYLKSFPQVSPPAIVSSESNTGSIWWFMNPDYRIGIGMENDKLFIKDLRFYHASAYRDNDQIVRDRHENLVRLVPSVIDAVALNNQITLGNAGDLKVVKTENSLSFNWDGRFLIASASGVRFSPDFKTLLEDRKIAYLVQNNSLLLKKPEVNSVNKDFCHDEYGHFAGRLPCLKKIITGLAGMMPDFVYSKLEGQSLLGFRTGFDSFWGIRFPKLNLGKLNFDYPVLDNFISLKKKLTPDFAWQGRQEYELEKFKVLGSVFEKGKIYGQAEITKEPPGTKLYENSYYAIFKK